MLLKTQEVPRRCELPLSPDLPTGRLCLSLFLGPFQGHVMRGLYDCIHFGIHDRTVFSPCDTLQRYRMRLPNKLSVEKAHAAAVALDSRLPLPPVAGVLLSQQTCAHHCHARVSGWICKYSQSTRIRMDRYVKADDEV